MQGFLRLVHPDAAPTRSQLPVLIRTSDFDALRKRDDFQKLVKELSVKAAAGDQSNSGKQPAPPG
jgi:hypothetical protein